MSIESIVKDGLLTDEIRDAFLEKIGRCGLSKSAIARRFGVSVVTFHKWLRGHTSRCSIASRRKILAFLQEDSITTFSRDYQNASERHLLPDNMLLCMERLNKVYDMVNTSSCRSKYFISMIDRAALEVLQYLLSLTDDKPLKQNDPTKKHE